MSRISPHVQATVDHLQGRGINVGRGVQPDGSGWQDAPGQSPFVPYAILWRIGAKDAVSTLIDDNEMAEARLLLFIRCFGGTVAEAEDLVDAVRDAMLDQSLTIPGRHLVSVILDNGQTTTKTEETEVALYEAGDFYRVWTKPA